MNGKLNAPGPSARGSQAHRKRAHRGRRVSLRASIATCEHRFFCYQPFFSKLLDARIENSLSGASPGLRQFGCVGRPPLPIPYFQQVLAIAHSPN